MDKKTFAWGTVAAVVLYALLIPGNVIAQQAVRATNLIANNAASYLTVRISDGTSFLTLVADAVFGTATYTEATTAGPPAGFVRNDTLDALVNTTNEIGPAATDALGRLWTRDANPCQDFSRITNVAIDTASSGNVELVALNGSDLVYVCGYDIVADAAVAVQFIYGTGTACATGETDLSGPMSFAANGGTSRGVTGAVQFKNVAGNALCIENSTTGGVRGSLQYVRTATP